MFESFKIPPASGIFYTIRRSLFSVGSASSDRLYSLPRLSISARCKLYGTASRITLVQTFVNTSLTDSIPTATYTFPLYDSCAVVAFRYTVGGSVFEGVIKEKQAAQTQFDAAVARNKTAGLLEQSTPDIFTATFGNIPARATIIVEIEYIVELKHDSQTDGLRFTIPVSIASASTPEPIDVQHAAVSACEGIKFAVEVAMPSNIHSVHSPSHIISLHLGSHSEDLPDDSTFDPKHAFISFLQKSADLAADFVLFIKCADLSLPRALLERHATISDSVALMVTLVPKFDLQAPRPPEMVFLVDRGTGMLCNMETVKVILVSFLRLLPTGLKFNVCFYGPTPSFLWTESMAVSPSAIQRAIHCVENTKPVSNRSAILPSIRAITANRPKDETLEIFVLASGLLCPVEDVFKCVREVTSGGDVRFFCVGVGDRPNHSFVEGIARAGGGYCQIITDATERMEDKITRMLKAGLSQHVQNLRMEWDGRPPDNEITQPIQMPPELAPSPRKIKLFDPGADLNSPITVLDGDQTDDQSFQWVRPAILQTPHELPPLFPFSRSTIYAIVSGPIPPPPSVWIRGRTQSGHDLELEIEVQFLSEMGATIHQLAAHKVLREMEEGTGFFHRKTPTEDGEDLVLEGPQGIDSHATRIGTTFGVASKWTSFVAVERIKEMTADRNLATRLDSPSHPETSREIHQAGVDTEDDSPPPMFKNIQYLTFHDCTINSVNRDQHNYTGGAPLIPLRRSSDAGSRDIYISTNSVFDNVEHYFGPVSNSSVGGRAFHFNSSCLSISIPLQLVNDSLVIATALTTLLADLHNQAVVADETLDARRHLLDFIKFSAKIKNWIIYKILDGDDVDARGRSFARAVKIALHCYRFRNFAAAAAIVQALQSHYITCLPQTLLSAKQEWTVDWPTPELLALEQEEAYQALEGTEPCLPRLDVHRLIKLRPGDTLLDFVSTLKHYQIPEPTDTGPTSFQRLEEEMRATDTSERQLKQLSRKVSAREGSRAWRWRDIRCSNPLTHNRGKTKLDYGASPRWPWFASNEIFTRVRKEYDSCSSHDA